MISLQHKDVQIPRQHKMRIISYWCFVFGRDISLYEDVLRIGRPYVYHTIQIIQLFIIKSWMRIPSNNPHCCTVFFELNQPNNKLLKVCKIHQIPNRRTIDKRFQCLPISEIIGAIGNLFVSEKLVDDISASVDNTMLKDAGSRWHKSDMNNNHLPIAGIDTDAKWSYSKSKDWVYGYKLHMC